MAGEAYCSPARGAALDGGQWRGEREVMTKKEVKLILGFDFVKLARLAAAAIALLTAVYLYFFSGPGR